MGRGNRRSSRSLEARASPTSRSARTRSATVLAMPEYVRDYPRPPRVEPVGNRVKIVFNGETVADTTNAKRVLETFGAPVYYLPIADVRPELLTETARSTVCAWK